MVAIPENGVARRSNDVWRPPANGMPDTITRERLFERVGQEFGASAWFRVGEDRIRQFIEVTGGRPVIRADTAPAKELPPDASIAHGMLPLSMILPLCRNVAPSVRGVHTVINYGLDRVRFIEPVKPGKRIRALARLLSATELSGRLLIKLAVTVEIEQETEPALIAEWLTLHLS